jgi:hypothetical protein
MTRIDAHGASRNLIENAFKYLTWHEEACKAAGFRGISQVWKEEPAWYFCLEADAGGFLLRLHDDEALAESQFISLSVHYYPATTSAKELSAEESRLIADRSVFDAATCTPRFERYEECLPHFLAAEIGMLIDADNQLQMLVYSTEGTHPPSAKLFDLLVNALNFAAKRHHLAALQLQTEEETSLFLIYEREAFGDFCAHFGLDRSTFRKPASSVDLLRWRRFAHLRVDCSMKGACCCH